MNVFFHTCKGAACLFEKTPTTEIITFECIVLIGVIILLPLLSRLKKGIPLSFLTISLGIFIFEFFTHPLWNNFNMGSWAYVYRDVSWILTFGWALIILVPITLVDKYLSHLAEWKRFFIYLFFILFLGIVAESAVVNLGIRTYSPESLEVINGKFIPGLGIPWVTLYYIPVFMALVVGFYKYWSVVFEKKLIVPTKKIVWYKKLIISIVGVLLFEIMIEPMVLNSNLPSWSYFYRDVSLLLTFGWVMIIWLSIFVIDKFFIHFHTAHRFFLKIVLASIIAMPLGALLALKNIQSYSVSTVSNFSGFELPLLNTPVEVVYSLPFYLALVIPFIDYWFIQINKSKIKK